MAVYEYECPKGHKFSRNIDISAPGEPKGHVPCPTCHDNRRKAAELIPSKTGAPILKAGTGGFYKPACA